MLKNCIHLNGKLLIFNLKFCQQMCFDLGLSQRISCKTFSIKSSEQSLGLPQMTNIDNNLNVNQRMDIYDESYIPSQLLRPGQSIWRFKRYFSLSKFKRQPLSHWSLESNKEWVLKLHIIEPKESVFFGKSTQKKKAEAIAMAKGLLWLRDNNFVDHSFNPIWSSAEERKSFMEKTIAPIAIPSIDDNIRYDMNSFIESFNADIKERIIKMSPSFNRKDKPLICDIYSDSEGTQFESESSDSQIIRNVLTNSVYSEPTNYELNQREEELQLFVEQRIAKQKRDKSYADLREKISKLPIAQFREEIIKTIQQNRIVVISGNTGCGKTTQVAQYILDNEISQQRGAFANIVVTQPRRISAISISERVALEFGEESVGNSIGYHVRFDKVLPNNNNGAVLFCSSGILLRKIGSNPNLCGVSHVIIDEVHERDIITDFLLVLLRRILRTNPNIRIILMSASMNAHLFSEYFDCCPLISIPGRCFAVEHFYLDVINKRIGDNCSNHRLSERNPKINKELIISLINYIDKNKGDGAILCFLPGWNEIQSIYEDLTLQNKTQNNLLIVPVHSKLPNAMQKRIFSKASVGVRKVILATNIAETSLTIDDVVFVIDPGLANEMRYNSILNVSAFGTHWISRANAKQRSGRAGRVKEGECYRLYTKEIENVYMEEFPMPELLRVPLEYVVMQAKYYCPNEAVEKFLSEVPQPPSSEAIKSAIKSLEEIKVFDSNENLTLLGNRIVSFTTHPRLSVALVYSSMFGCLTSMLSLVSHLSASREPFQVMPNEREKIREIKRNFSFDILSDHVSLVHLTNEYENLLYNRSELSSFINENYLSRYAMNNIFELKRLYASHLEESQFIEKNSWKYIQSDINCNWHRKQVLITSLMSALVPNYVKLMAGKMKNDKINWNKISAIDANSGKRVKFRNESLFSVKPAQNEVEKLANSFVVYYGCFFSQEARMLTICDASLVSPLSLLLFCDNKFEFNLRNNSNLSDEECVIVLRNNKHLEFKINRQDLQMISQWNDIFNLFSQWFLIPKNQDSNVGENDLIKDSLKVFIQLTDELIQSYN